MSTNLDQAMAETLRTIATPEEVDTLLIIFDGMSHGHIEIWYLDFIREIISRLAQLTKDSSRT